MSFNDTKKEYFYRSGQIMSREYYKNDQLHGKCWVWYGCGRLFSLEHYKNGKLHGKCKEWWDNGVLWNHRFYKDGRLHGKWKVFKPDGVLEYQELYYEGIRYPHNLSRLQQLFRQTLKAIRFNKWLKSRSFAEWWWDPNNTGGKWLKIQAIKELEML